MAWKHSLMCACILLMLSGCEPEKTFVSYVEPNQHTRLDRQPLTPDQRPDSLSAADLFKGVYRTGNDQIISESYPAAMSDVAGSLPQSSCMWIGDGEGMRFHWETQFAISSDDLDRLGLSPDTGPLTNCRLNDAITRQPPRAIDDNDEYVTLFTGDTNSNGLRELEYLLTDFRKILLEDVAYFGSWLTDYPTGSNPLNQCQSVPLTDAAGAIRIARGVQAFTGPVDNRGLTSDCSGPFGFVLRPVRDSSYELWNENDPDMAPDVKHVFRPSIKLASEAETLGRLMQRDQSTLTWATPSEGNTATSLFWDENFSLRINTVAARLFILDSSQQRQYLNAGDERLCITDPQTGTGCRWLCDATAEASASTFYVRAASQSEQGCRAQPGNTPDYPAVTPTYAKEHLCNPREDLQCQPIGHPLQWSIGGSVGGSVDVYIEFEIKPVFESMALRVSPARSDLGSTKIGNKLQANFEIMNIGGVPIEVDDLRMIAHPESAAIFQTHALTGSQWHPLPIRVDKSGIQLAKEGVADPRVTLAEGEQFRQLRRISQDGSEMTIQNHVVNFDGDFMIRDSMNADLGDPKLDPAFYPVRASSFVYLSPPFTLMPDETVEVLVNVTPTAYHGIGGSNEHLGWLHVEAANLDDPGERKTAEIPVSVHALWGPALNVFPQAISLPRRGMEPPAANTGSLLAANYGDVSLDIVDLSISGRDATQFSLQSSPATPFTLTPGDARVLRVHYQNRCDGNAWQGHQATLKVITTHESGSIVLHGAADCTLMLP